MADEMLRVAGRSEDGLSKGLSVVTDDMGNGVVRTVDAAPVAYNANTNSLRVENPGGSEVMFSYRNPVMNPGDESIPLDERRPIEIDKFELRITDKENPNVHVYFGLYQSDGTLIYPFGNKIDSGKHDYFRLEADPVFPVDDIWRHKVSGAENGRGGFALNPEYLPLKCPFGAKVTVVLHSSSTTTKMVGSYVNYRVIG